MSFGYLRISPVALAEDDTAERACIRQAPRASAAETPQTSTHLHKRKSVLYRGAEAHRENRREWMSSSGLLMSTVLHHKQMRSSLCVQETKTSHPANAEGPVFNNPNSRTQHVNIPQTVLRHLNMMVKGS